MEGASSVAAAFEKVGEERDGARLVFRNRDLTDPGSLGRVHGLTVPERLGSLGVASPLGFAIPPFSNRLVPREAPTTAVWDIFKTWRMRASPLIPSNSSLR